MTVLNSDNRLVADRSGSCWRMRRPGDSFMKLLMMLGKRSRGPAALMGFASEVM
jgi:hypothetical protein